ncbi:MAG TPA: hypothetical protein VGB01_03370, partial [candidate division Zixibacteria bacterium]
LSNFIPFISFMVITKDIQLLRRTFKLVIGLLILTGGHLLLGIGFYLLPFGYPTPSPLYYRISLPLYVFTQFLPFLLWVILAKRNLLKLFISRRALAQD